MLYGERVRLRAIERVDQPLFVKWLNDPEVREGVGIYAPFSETDEDTWFENMLKTPADQHPMVIEIPDEEHGWLPIGDIGFHVVNWRVREAEFGIVIGDKTCWNRGYGSEAVRLLIAHGFETLNLNRIALRVYETNPRAVHAYEKVGFRHEGRLRQAHYAHGKYVDVLIMSILREEYEHA